MVTPIQIITRKGLTKPMVRFILPMMQDISRSVGNVMRERKLRCDSKNDNENIKCLYELIITHGEVVDAVINVAKRWKERNPGNFWFSVKDGEDEEDVERTIDMYYYVSHVIIHLRFYVDILENPLRLKFFVEAAVHELSESIDMNLIMKHLWMPLEPVETMEVPL